MTSKQSTDPPNSEAGNLNGVVLDGRTDAEKLRELLGLAEQTHLDFKASVDFSKPKDRLEFVKDAVSMSNRPQGGYIIVGAHEGGKLCLCKGTLNRKEFDGAVLGDRIRKYIEGETHPIAQVHDIDGYEVALIYIPPHRDGLPVPMNKIGQYQDSTGDRIVFRDGDVLLREGAKNIPLRHAHWGTILGEHDRQVREQARELAETLIAKFVQELGSNTANASPGAGSRTPLLLEMEGAAFAEAVLAHLDSNSDLRLRRFTDEASVTVSTSEDADDRISALDKLTIVAVQGMYYERPEVVSMAIGALERAYLALAVGSGANNTRLALVTRLYVIGAQAVRLRVWDVVPSLVLRRVPSSEYSEYFYSSWIRHGQVEAARSNLFDDKRSGLMITLARDMLTSHAELRPDVPDSAVPPADSLGTNDALLNSLCQFDVLYCLVVMTEGKDHGSAYPASSAYNSERSAPAFVVVATDPQARRQMFSESDDARIAQTMVDVNSLAMQQSFRMGGGGWWGLPAAAQAFVEEYLRVR